MKEEKSTILIVDDDPDNLRLLRSILISRKYNVRIATSGQMALHSVESECPDLIVLDVKMPGFDGYEVCRCLKSENHTKHIPVLFISGAKDAKEKLKSFFVGGVDYITKPFHSQEVLARIHVHLTIQQLNVQLVEAKENLEQKVEKRTFELKKVNVALKQSESRLGEKNKELEKFNYTVSHDLKTPLISIGGYIGILKESVVQGNLQEVNHCVTRIESSLYMMGVLLEKLREFSLIGCMKQFFQESSLEEIARKVIEMFESQLKEKQIYIRLLPNLPVIYCDSVRIYEVFQNLIDNAIKFMGDQRNPSIEIGVTRIEGENVYYIRDNGIGIDFRNQQKIFGLFDRLDSKISGVGAGLAIVKRIVEYHSGRIWVKSQEGVGSGATFYFTLGKRVSL